MLCWQTWVSLQNRLPATNNFIPFLESSAVEPNNGSVWSPPEERRIFLFFVFFLGGAETKLEGAAGNRLDPKKWLEHLNGFFDAWIQQRRGKFWVEIFSLI